MRIAFLIVTLLIAFIATLDITCGDSGKKNTGSIAGAMGFDPIRRRPDSVAVFLISILANVVVLVVEVMA